MLKRAEDTIPDPLSQWILPELELGSVVEEFSGRNMPVPDILAAEDTWINTFYADWEYKSPRRWATRHRFKWDWWHQRDADAVFAPRRGWGADSRCGGGAGGGFSTRSVPRGAMAVKPRASLG